MVLVVGERAMILRCPACGSRNIEMDPGDLTKRVCLDCGKVFTPKDDFAQVGDGTEAQLVDRPLDTPDSPAPV